MMSTEIFDGVKMLFTIIFPFILHVIQSSMVHDESRQKGVYVSKYCPKMKYCAEGTHVMCMFYNPNEKFGPQCSNPQNISITPAIAEKLLDVSNAIRGKIARGTEKGKNGELLPRAYGMFRLSWDKELATFAQVLANSCILRLDLCRATERFPDPAQAAGKARFSYPEWSMLSKAKISKPGLNDDKLMYAADQALKSWYAGKGDVDKEIILKYPDWVEKRSTRGRLYLAMIHGSATHMGCGISAYTEYAYYGNGGTNYNIVQIICNFSGKPRPGTAVYNTVPPSAAESLTNRCGCPSGSEGDNECLCVEAESHEKLELDASPKCKDGACDPTVVVLPIFTMENTPPDQIFNSLTNNSMDKYVDDSIFGNLREHNLLRHDNNKYSNRQARHYNGLQTDNNIKVRFRKRNFGQKEIDTNPAVDTRYSRQSLRTPTKHVQKKSSIFTRASRFSLPATRNNKEYGGIHPIKRDVVPRKDFSDAKKLVDKYIYGKSSLFNPIERKSINYKENDIHNTENGNNHHEIIRPHNGEEVLHVGDHTSLHNTESSLSLIEKNVVHHDDFDKDLPKDSIFDHNEPIQSISATSDNKLMNLLDTLEREVKHIEIGDKDRELFDERIRKIYGKVVGKPVEGLGTMPDKHESKNQIDDNLEKHSRWYTGHTDISDNHELHKDKNDLIFEHYDDPAAANDHNEQRKTRDRNLYRSNDIESTKINKNGYRHVEHNGIDSHENKYDDFDFNYRKDPYKREHYSRKSMTRHDNREDHKSNHKNYYLNHDGDPLSTERRKYYQDKLDNIERRLNRMRNHKRRTILDDRHVRAMLAPQVRKSENQIDSFYIPDRARFLHGY